MQWVKSLVGKIQSIVAIDGKTLRGSGEMTSDLNVIHMVSAFATNNEIILGQLKTAGKGKELEGIKLILQLLDLEGTTVTIDAGGCHKEVAELIRSKKADYILGVKGNQGNLLAEIANFFTQVLYMIKLEKSRKLSTNKKRTLVHSHKSFCRFGCVKASGFDDCNPACIG